MYGKACTALLLSMREMILFSVNIRHQKLLKHLKGYCCHFLLGKSIAMTIINKTTKFINYCYSSHYTFPILNSVCYEHSTYKLNILLNCKYTMLGNGKDCAVTVFVFDISYNTERL